MLGLLPSELWEYGLNQVWHSVGVALNVRNENKNLEIPGIGSCIPTRSARSGLVLALKALRLSAGARIGVPLYCCPVVFKAIHESDCVPVFVDIDPGTFCISAADLRKKSAQIDGVIAVHMFGNVCDIPLLQEAVPGKPIIEDCALSLGSKFNGHQTGSLGDIGVFSFRSGKYLSVGEGGALFSRGPEIQERASTLVSQLPELDRTAEVAHVAKTYVRSTLRSRPLYGLIGHALWESYNKKVEYSGKSPIVHSQIFATDLSLTRERLTRLNSMIEIQRVNADYYFGALSLDRSMLCHEEEGTFYNRYQFPVSFPSQETRDAMAAHLQRHGIETSKPVNDIVEVASAHYNYVGDCPVAESLSKRVLVIPSYYTLKKQRIQSIAQCLNRGWKEISKTADASTPAKVSELEKGTVGVRSVSV